MAVGTDNQGYRRGVVLGFTVAEIVMLFVFCLLLLLAPAILGNEQPKAGTAETRPNPSVQPGPPVASSPQNNDAGSVPAGSPHEQKPTPNRPSDNAKVPSDWSIIVPGGKIAVTHEALCAVAGIQKEDCTPNKLPDLLASRGQHNWPPIIRLREADGEFFALGRAAISDGLSRRIAQQVIPEISRIATQYDVNVIEVIGHTDEQPIQGGASNLDALALGVLTKGTPASALTAADNAGLGLARAVAVVQLLRGDPRLNRFSIIPVSAGQLVDTTGQLSDGSKGGDVKERRRIEIRLRRSDDPSPQAAPRTASQ